MSLKPATIYLVFAHLMQFNLQLMNALLQVETNVNLMKLVTESQRIALTTTLLLEHRVTAMTTLAH
jgi:hypothetical protein